MHWSPVRPAASAARSRLRSRARVTPCASTIISEKDLADELAALLRSEGHEAIAVQADVSKRAEVNAMVAQCERELGKVTLLVNNAGVAGQELFRT